MLEDATHDMPQADGTDLYKRFLGWMRDLPARTSAKQPNSPNDALKLCEELELEHPEWDITYSSPGDPRWPLAGFHAIRKAAWRPESALFGTDIDELELAIQAWQPPPSYGIRMVPVDETDPAKPQVFPALVGSSEIGERTGLDQEYIESIARSESFPRPVATLAQGCLWLTNDVEEWIHTHRPDLGS